MEYEVSLVSFIARLPMEKVMLRAITLLYAIEPYKTGFATICQLTHVKDDN